MLNVNDLPSYCNVLNKDDLEYKESFDEAVKSAETSREIRCKFTKAELKQVKDVNWTFAKVDKPKNMLDFAEVSNTFFKLYMQLCSYDVDSKLFWEYIHCFKGLNYLGQVLDKIEKSISKAYWNSILEKFVEPYINSMREFIMWCFKNTNLFKDASNDGLPSMADMEKDFASMEQNLGVEDIETDESTGDEEAGDVSTRPV